MSKIKLKSLKTPESDALTGNEWNEIYPRPQLRRDSFIPLNGEWDFCFAGEEMTKITVPFPPESEMSGIGECRGSELHYKRTFTPPEIPEGHRLILNLGATDQTAEVLINRVCAGRNRGGVLPSSVDITNLVREGENEIHIIVYDDITDTTLPYGKQRKKRGGMWYTTVSGIWQSVWLEIVPIGHIRALKITPNESGARVELLGLPNYRGKATVTTPEGKAEYEISDSVCEIKLDNPRKWSPDDPYLYDLEIACGEDRVSSYFAVRTVEIKEVNGVPRILLNGEPIFFHGLLDQGYYPEGIYTPVSPKSIENDILIAKSLGFNTLRKHIKVEHELFYYYCDKHGMIVFQDMVNNGKYSFLRDTALPTIGFKRRHDRRVRGKRRLQRAIFALTMEGTVNALYNHPCIVYWTIFNEGWGQIDSQGMYSLLCDLDKTRVIDTASGWFKGADSDVVSEHVYFKKIKDMKPCAKPIILSEFGGYSYKIPEHSANIYKTYGYGKFEDVEEYERAVLSLYSEQIIPQIKNGLCASILTQISDVEDETNGIMTYDRRVIKLSSDKMCEISRTLRAEIAKK